MTTATMKAPTAKPAAPKRSLLRAFLFGNDRAGNARAASFQEIADEYGEVADAFRSIVGSFRAQHERLQTEIADLNEARRTIADELARLRATSKEPTFKEREE